MSQHHQQKIPPFSSNSPPPIDLDDLDFHEGILTCHLFSIYNLTKKF